MPTDQKILSEIESAIAFCEGFMDRLIKFKKEVIKGDAPQRKRGQGLSDEERKRNSALYFGSITKKTCK
jgi:hypothetical protein